MIFKILSKFQDNSNLAKINLLSTPVDYFPVSLTDVKDGKYFRYTEFIYWDESWDFAQGKTYIFPIFWESTSPTYIDELIQFTIRNLELFLEKKLIIVFLDPLEGNDGIAPIIDQYVSATGIDNIYFVSADKKLETRNNLFTFVYVDHWVHHVTSYDTTIKYKPSRLYINLTRMPRSHRCYLMQAIIDNNLFDDGYNTWADANFEVDKHAVFAEHECKDTIAKQTFCTLDVKNIRAVNPTHIMPIKHCIGTFIYLNTETHVGNNVLFLSEKTYKPIAAGMPFMTLGNPGTLKYLQDQGYATFSHWVDESYDKDLALADRIQIIIDNLLYIKSLTNEQRITMRRSMQSICKHNQDLYRIKQKKDTIIEKLTLIEKGYI